MSVEVMRSQINEGILIDGILPNPISELIPKIDRDAFI